MDANAWLRQVAEREDRAMERGDQELPGVPRWRPNANGQRTVCERCGELRLTFWGHSLCRTCYGDTHPQYRENQRAAQRRRVARKIALGECVQGGCQLRPVAGRYCEEHRERRNALRKPAKKDAA